MHSLKDKSAPATPADQSFIPQTLPCFFFQLKKQIITLGAHKKRMGCFKLINFQEKTSALKVVYAAEKESGSGEQGANCKVVKLEAAYRVANEGGDGLSGTDKAGYGLNAFGFANGAKTELINYAVRSGSRQAGIRAELQVLGKAGTRYLQAAKGLGFMAGVAGVAVTGIDAYNKGQWQNHHTADVLIGVGSLYLLTGPVGWAIGGGYFLLDVGIKSYTR